MISRNLRHFRVFLAVVDLGSPTRAAQYCNVSQPAVTQAVHKLEGEAGGALFTRKPQGFEVTERGKLLDTRIRRAIGRLDRSLSDISSRLIHRATAAQLQAVIATTETQSFSRAARALGVSQPTIHRAVSQVEQEASKPLFERTSFGLVASSPCRDLAQSARLAFAELRQVEADLAEFDGREVGTISIGTLPLSRSVLLPEALAQFRKLRPRQGISVYDGPYDETLGAVRRGDMDFMIGALRDPLPFPDVQQEPLFLDHLSVICRPGHGLADKGGASLEDLAEASWVVPRRGTPSREQFDAIFAGADLSPPDSILECGSILLMRELLNRSDMLGCISGLQAEAEVSNGALVRLETDVSWTGRKIGLTYRVEWVPTRAQSLMLEMIRANARALRQGQSLRSEP
ncbi:LysR family transcriptional regulator [Jannaschia sp. EhC01]|nr:LysR family transcriptional regulator [Jannaschia sp. EhC01]